MNPTRPPHSTAFTEFGLSSIAVNHPVVVVALTVILVIMGLVSYINVPKESSPEIVVPFIAVNTIYSGVAPKDIETLITRPLEDELNTIADVKQITSTSIEGYSSITVEFQVGMDMNEALQRVREKVDLAKPELPPQAEEPGIVEFNFAEFPIMQVNVSGSYSLERLREVAEDLQDRLEQIPSVLEVQLSGGLEREVQVDVDLAKLKFYNLSFDDVIGAIRQENVTIPGGSIDVGDMRYLVRVPGEFEAPEPIADVVIDTKNGRPIYVRDVAGVDFGFKERDSYARLDGQAVISLAIVKRSGENIIETAARVREVITQQSARFPPGTVVKITSDQSEEIREMVSSLENNIISGLILVSAVLLFVLGARTASFVGLAIPTSMLLSFSVIQLAGFSMNMVVLFSLILALGMLVDNAIVVVENIYRFREQGFDRAHAAKYGTAEVAVPIIASTATTLAAFLPMAFWPGIIGEFMKFLPLTLIITLSSSLFVALVIVPTMCALMLDPEDAPPVPLTPAMKRLLIGLAVAAVVVTAGVNPLTAVLLLVTATALYAFHHHVGRPAGHWFMAQGLPRILVHYRRLLDWALRHGEEVTPGPVVQRLQASASRWRLTRRPATWAIERYLDHRLRMLAAAGGTLVVAILSFAVLNAGIELFPEDIPPATVYAQVEAPQGTRVELTDRLAHAVESRLARLEGHEDFESVVATAGSQLSGGGFGGGLGGHVATVAVNFVDFEDRTTDVFATLERMREQIATWVAGADVSVEVPNPGPPTGLPVTIEISGDAPERLRRYGDSVVTILENSPVFPKLDGLESDMAEGRPELVVEVDREKAALYGLSTQLIGSTLRSAINGTVASKYRDGNDEYDITVRLAKPYRDDLSSLGDLTIVEDGQQIPLSSVARWYVGQGFGDVRRKDLDRVVTISSDVRAGYNGNAVLAEAQQILADFRSNLPAGYRMVYTGEQQEQQEAEEFLSGAFVLAVFLIGLILISQFNSLTKPLIILSSVLLSTIGVLIGLMLFRMPFGIIMTGVGVISLAGVVVNNSIVLIDYVDILRKRDGLPRRQAILQGGVTRFRPVILTAITTVLGLVPLAVGLNFDFIGLYARLSPDFFWGGEQAAWWGPMAIAVIAGLSFATFLTLVLVPVMYSLLDDFDDWVSRTFRPRFEVTDEHPVLRAEVGPPPVEEPAREPVTVRGRLDAGGLTA